MIGVRKGAACDLGGEAPSGVGQRAVQIPVLLDEPGNLPGA